MARAPTPSLGDELLLARHWDHIQGFPFSPRSSFPQNQYTVCGPEEQHCLREVLSGQIRVTYFPVEIGQLTGRRHLRELGEGRTEMEARGSSRSTSIIRQ